jgi:hypothetical protein
VSLADDADFLDQIAQKYDQPIALIESIIYSLETYRNEAFPIAKETAAYVGISARTDAAQQVAEDLRVKVNDIKTIIESIANRVRNAGS